MAKVDAEALLKAARDAEKGAYAPYSGVAKGAALLCSDGSVYTGANVEFVTFGGSVCAELGVLTRAVNDGKQSFTALALTPHRFPCGACRQFFNEFGLEMDVLTARQDGAVEQKSLAELLPKSFGKSNLD